MNEKITWSIEFTKKYEDKWNWYWFLFRHKNLPFSSEFLETFESKLDSLLWSNLCANTNLKWDIKIIHKYIDKLSYSENIWNTIKEFINDDLILELLKKQNPKTMRIAGRLTIQDWIDLVGGINENEVKIDYNSNTKWGLAFHFFEERIVTRYLKPINAILEIGDNLGEGFAVVNLQCSLIETIESFINGWTSEFQERGIVWKNKSSTILNSDIGMTKDSEKNMKNRGVFYSFFKNRKNFKDLDIDGEDFYKSIRCGLLHETQTKNGWKIKAKGTEKSIKNKIIYRENFQHDLINLIDKYKDVIINGGELDGIPANKLRENFTLKFNHICKESL